MTRSDHIKAHDAVSTEWAQAASTLGSSQPPPVPPATDRAQQAHGFWKVLSASIYFLSQTLGILTFIIPSTPHGINNKKTNSYPDFFF